MYVIYRLFYSLYIHKALYFLSNRLVTIDIKRRTETHFIRMSYFSVKLYKNRHVNTSSVFYPKGFRKKQRL